MENKITKENFDKYAKEMWARLEMGQQKYGDKYNNASVVNEMLQEAVDLSNYAFMLYIKAADFAEKHKNEL